MGTISITGPSDGDTIDASDVNTPLNTIVNAINGGLDSNNITAGGIATASLAADAVTDAKLVKGKILGRQGGSATNWSTAGTNNYDYSGTNTVIQVGCSIGNSGADVTVTFGTAFSQVPIVVGSDFITNSNCMFIVATCTASLFTFRMIDSGGTQRSNNSAWVAFGE